MDNESATVAAAGAAAAAAAGVELIIGIGIVIIRAEAVPLDAAAARIGLIIVPVDPTTVAHSLVLVALASELASACPATLLAERYLYRGAIDAAVIDEVRREELRHARRLYEAALGAEELAGARVKE